MRWSDDKLKSNFHRVRMPTPGEDQGSRYSIAYFNQVTFPRRLEEVGIALDLRVVMIRRPSSLQCPAHLGVRYLASLIGTARTFQPQLIG